MYSCTREYNFLNDMEGRDDIIMRISVPEGPAGACRFALASAALCSSVTSCASYEASASEGVGDEAPRATHFPPPFFPHDKSTDGRNPASHLCQSCTA